MKEPYATMNNALNKATEEKLDLRDKLAKLHRILDCIEELGSHGSYHPHVFGALSAHLSFGKCMELTDEQVGLVSAATAIAIKSLIQGEDTND